MKFILYSFAFILLLATPALGAITSVGTLGTCSSVASGSTCVITTSATLDANNIALVRIGADNVGTTAAVSTEVSGVTDSAGNSYEKLCEYRYSEGVLADGAVISVWAGRAATQLTSGGTITITFANSITTKAAQAQELAVTSGNKLQVAGTCMTENLNGADPGNLTLSGLPSKEYYFLRALAVESATGAITATTSADWTAITGINSSTGTAATSMTTAAERRIFTGTGLSSDPTFSAFSTDGASIFVALEECTPAVNCTGDVVARPRPPIIVQ